MFDYIWNRNKQYKNSRKKTEVVFGRIVPVIWSEHCVECSAPACYQSCSIYAKREDGKCVRIIDAIQPIYVNEGAHVKEGAHLHFAKWAKIECVYYPRTLDNIQVIKIAKVFNCFGDLAVKFARVMPWKQRWILTDGLYSLRQKVLKRILKKEGKESHNLYLVLKVHSEQTQKMFVEIKDDTGIVFRNSFNVDSKGEIQYIKIPDFEDFKRRFMCIYFENSSVDHIVEFDYLEIVDGLDVPSNFGKPEKKVKCVIWDLDNTLWQGTLIEDNAIKINESIIMLIKELDGKGIVSSICSKNDYDTAYKKLQEYGIEDYFVFPMINWLPKSINIKNIASKMNISEDTIVFVDDNPFEREEVMSGTKDVSVVDVKDIFEYVKGTRFDVVVTEDSKNRRQTYHMMEKQQKEFEAWSGNIDDFLRSCNMKLVVGEPKESELQRCYELLQRTNQLNASGRRLSYEDVVSYYQSNDYKTYVLICSDKFGSYGQVGFAIIEDGDIPLIKDFVISCRVANKKVEHAFLCYLAKSSKLEKIQIVYKQTSRNAPIFKVVEDLEMILVEKVSEYNIYEFECNEKIVNVVDVVSR